MDLLLPGLPESIESAPSLQRLLAFAERKDCEAKYQELLKAARHPSAAWFADDVDDPAQHYLLASPVHLRPDMDRLLLFPAQASGIDETDCDALSAPISEHLQDDGVRVHSLPTMNAWLLALDEPARITSTSLYDAAGMNIDQLLPEGERGTWWRQRMTELQMLLHSCEHNEQRTDKAQVTVNGVWIWAQSLAERPKQLAGSAQWLRDDRCFKDVIGPGAEWLDDRLLQAGLSLNEQDKEDTLAELDSELFAPALSALRAGRIRELAIHHDQGQSWYVRRPPSWQFWKRL